MAFNQIVTTQKYSVDVKAVVNTTIKVMHIVKVKENVEMINEIPMRLFFLQCFLL